MFFEESYFFALKLVFYEFSIYFCTHLKAIDDLKSIF